MSQCRREFFSYARCGASPCAGMLAHPRAPPPSALGVACAAMLGLGSIVALDYHSFYLHQIH